MNPHEVNAANLITKTPIKKQIKGRTDITVPFRIQKDENEEKALIQFKGAMKVFERDGIFSLGISILQHLEFDKKKHPERIPIEHLEKVIQQKAEKAKPEILQLFPKIKFQPQDFQLIKDREFQGGTYSKVWAKMYNDKKTQEPQTNFRMLLEVDGKQSDPSEARIIKKGRKLTVGELIGVSFKGIAFCNLSLFLNSNNKSIRFVAEDVGVLEIFERKSEFDKYDDHEEEEAKWDGPWSEKF